ncbi:MAG: DEAD/DEAH box helicase family protein [Bacteroidales bacterium]|nr:DEAD/DEAH box helicase family protein [Bacteroidales bacterium]
MTSITAQEYFIEIKELLEDNKLTLSQKFKRTRFLFERLCKQITSKETAQFPNLFARLSWILQHILTDDKDAAIRLSTLRIHLNRVCKGEVEPNQDELEDDLRTLVKAVSILLDEPVDTALQSFASKKRNAYLPKEYKISRIKRIRARFISYKDNVLKVIPEEKEDNEPINVRLKSENDGTQPFKGTLENLYPGAQINLVDTYFSVEENMIVADMVILEPDFLLDISAIAECYQDYGNHPLNYFYSRLNETVNSRYIILGNIANQFLDDIINETEDTPADYLLSMKKAFGDYPINIAACEELEDSKISKDFFQETKNQFFNIRKVVNTLFGENSIDPSKALLEPSFVCETLGIQGRLDLLQEDYTKFIELKSGKAKEIFGTDKIMNKENHYVQMLLYYAVLKINKDVDPNKIDAYLLYSKYPLLYRMPHYQYLIKDALNLRNMIVALEYLIQKHNDYNYSKSVLRSIIADTLNTNHLTNRLWTGYIKTKIDKFSSSLSELTPIEDDYYYSLFTFITKEQFTSKAGNPDKESNKGNTLLCNGTLDDKKDAGEIIVDLKIIDSSIINSKHYLTLSINQLQDDECIPNFRTGDSVILYLRDDETKNISNSQVFKASIDEIDAQKIKLCLRVVQKNSSVLPKKSLYAMERDYMDVPFASMLKGLSQFLSATNERRSLLLGERTPRWDSTLVKNAYDNDVDRIVDKAYAAKDYFLLVGPPGTGKTSYALRRMVERFYSQPNCNILLLAYTNKAVDEICHSISSIAPDFPFVRIGQEAACDDAFKDRLLKNVMRDSTNRIQVRNKISNYRVFVGTLSSVSRETQLFQLKSFDVAIVDEATQILEPQIIGLLCSKDKAGKDAVKKFILIGDYKQLPAVVVQSDESSLVKSDRLNAIGINSLKESLFERLYRLEKKLNRNMCFDMLTRQGRMHPEISEFPSKYFYAGRLTEIPVEHQKESWSHEANVYDFSMMVKNKRLAFFPVEKKEHLTSNKINPQEAKVVADILKYWLMYNVDKKGSISDYVGIITPYRSQIAMIRKELQNNNIPDAANIVIDTVERFQGAQKDLMIYSCCINMAYQLEALSNTIEDEGLVVDRKLNVALTRARRQMFIVGNPAILKRDNIYCKLIDYIQSKSSIFLGDYPEL